MTQIQSIFNVTWHIIVITPLESGRVFTSLSAPPPTFFFIGGMSSLESVRPFYHID